MKPVRDTKGTPFSPGTSLEYTLQTEQEIIFSIYDTSGKAIMIVEQGRKSVGKHIVQPNISNLSSGAYYAVLRNQDSVLSRQRFILMK